MSPYDLQISLDDIASKDEYEPQTVMPHCRATQKTDKNQE